MHAEQVKQSVNVMEINLLSLLPRPMSHSRHGAGRTNSFLGSSNRRARTIILQIEGLNDEVCTHYCLALPTHVDTLCRDAYRGLGTVGVTPPPPLICCIIRIYYACTCMYIHIHKTSKGVIML